MAVGLAGCSSAPETTIVDDSGEERTISWSDYPAHAAADAQAALAAPTPEQVEARERRMVDAIKAAVDEDYGFDWATEGESGWSDREGNGYGGESYLTTYNSAALMSDGVPEGADAWRDVLRQIDAVLADFELAGLELLHESSPYSDEEQWREELVEKFGTTDPDEYWQWTAESSSGSEWVSLTFTDVAKDPAGEAAEEREGIDLPGQSISVSYGATTVPAEERDAYRQALEPFDGLAKPESSTYD